MSTYQIFHQNHPIGALDVSREGLFTVFTAACEAVAPKLRLAVCGAASSAYLGLMVAEADGRLRLRKRLSRLECEKLPRPILYAASAEEPAPVTIRDTDDWTARPDGTLRKTNLVAIPLERVSAPGVDKRLLQTIDGREYLVFSLNR